jgi:DNA-binding response OmpR family regulator
MRSSYCCAQQRSSSVEAGDTLIIACDSGVGVGALRQLQKLPLSAMKAKVLVVEDSKGQRDALVSELQVRGYEVTEATGGLVALARIKADPPDVVILDVVLDDMDGYSVCRWLRLGESTCDIVVIMLTVKVDVKERVEGLHVGADDYIPKPFDMDELEARIFAALRRTLGSSYAREIRSSRMLRARHLAMTDAHRR